jgi:hypothetical protein
MNWLQFFASVAGSFAWPITVVALVVLLRKPVARVLLTLTKLKYKDLELNFGRELKELEQQARTIEVQPTPAPVLPAPDVGRPDLLVEAERLAQEFPEPAVAVGWQAVEHELASAVVRRSIAQEYPRRNSAGKNADLLLKHGAVDEQTIELLKRMRNLRNMAVHPETGPVRITTDEAIEFIALSRGIVEKLHALPVGP